MKLHIALGWVSEDQMRSPDVPPNGRLDTEDRTPEGGTGPDGQLDVTGGRTEDTGYDQLTDAEEKAAGIPIRDLKNANAQDPEGDDFHPVSDNNPHDDINPDDFRGSDGTEGNPTLQPHPRTEDLDPNTHLHCHERNFGC